MAPPQLQTMRDGLNAHRMAVSAKLNTRLHLFVHVMPSLDQRRMPVAGRRVRLGYDHERRACGQE